MLGMERVVVGVVLLVVGLVGAGRAWQAFRARHVAVGVRDRTITRGGIAGLLLCLAIGELGVYLLSNGVTGAGADRIARRVLAVVVFAAVAAVVYGVIAWRRRRRARPAVEPPEDARPAPAVPAAPAPTPVAWVPPTPQAAALRAARDAGDTEAVCAALASRPVLWSVDDADVDGVLDGTRARPAAVGRLGRDGVLELPVATDGCAPTPPPTRSLLRARVDRCATADRPYRLVVDEGHAHGVVVKSADLHSWLQRHPDPETWDVPAAMRALAPVAPADAFVHGLACAAWHAQMNDDPWNRFGPRHHDRLAARLVLREGWGIETARDWQQMLDRLADPEPFQGDLVFGLRRRLGDGAFVGADEVAAVVEHNAEHNGREVTDAVLADLRRVEAYETYLREHQVLAPWEQVHSLLAWDLGRGAMLARYGLDAGFCDESTGRWQVERFGTVARRCYDSWPEFGAALVLGRALWTAGQVDESDWPAMELSDCVEPFRVLTTDPASPWRTVPFHPAPAAAVSSDAGT